MKKRLFLFVLSAALALFTAGCGNARPTENEAPAPEPQTAPAGTAEPQAAPAGTDGPQAAPAGTDGPQTAPAGTDAPPAETGRQDGERFEAVIVIEGMEETVRYEHIRNEAAGLEMDYDYESFARRSEAGRECFISIWDDPENPENYLEVTYSAEDADTAAAAVSEALSRDYEISRHSHMLDGAGDCIRIDASGAKGGGASGSLQQTYIIPAPDGCLVAAAHCTLESAEGFGRRFDCMMNTLTVLDR